MATHSSTLAWRIPGMAEPGGLPSMGSHRVGHDWSDVAAAAAPLSKGSDSLLMLSAVNSSRLQYHRLVAFSNVAHSYYGCSDVLPKSSCWSPNCQNLRMRSFLEIGSLQRDTLQENQARSSRMQPWSNMTGCRKEKWMQRQTHREKKMWRQRGEEGHRRAKETGLGQPLPPQSSEESNLAKGLVLDFQPPELCNNKILLFKPSRLWYFVTVDLQIQHLYK